MLASRLTQFGPAADVLSVGEIPHPEPASDELLLEMLAAPINPADLNVIEGKYGELPELPAVIGNEGVGRVTALGEGVAGFSMGDLVLPLRLGTWTQFMTIKAAQAVRIPEGANVFQAAMLSVNPPTAWLMLKEFVDLKEGEWVVQNAANSGVGRSAIQIAKSRGLKTLNVVRRPELIDELKALGADAVVLEETDLRAAARELCGGSRPRLALNAVGGNSALNLANALADRGTMVTYGAMGRQPLKIPNGLLIFRNLEFKGFWLKRWKDEASPEALRQTLETVAALCAEGRLHVPVHRVFPLADLPKAVEEASQGSRSGKVLLDLRG